MRKTTRQQRANDAVCRFEEALRRFPPKTSWGPETLERLRSLGPNPDPDTIDRIIGNDSWTSTECSECGAINVPIVQFEESSCGTGLCAACLEKALRLIKEQQDDGAAPMKPSWDDAPSWARWLYQERYGSWYWSAKKPGWSKNGWFRPGGEIQRIEASDDTPWNDAWVKTLEPRPENTV